MFSILTQLANMAVGSPSMRGQATLQSHGRPSMRAQPTLQSQQAQFMLPSSQQNASQSSLPVNGPSKQAQAPSSSPIPLASQPSAYQGQNLGAVPSVDMSHTPPLASFGHSTQGMPVAAC